MSDNRNFCPVCEQIIQTSQERVEVKVSPSRTIRVHTGCALLISVAYDDYNEQDVVDDIDDENNGDDDINDDVNEIDDYK